jgi:hypothetical protein
MMVLGAKSGVTKVEAFGEKKEVRLGGCVPPEWRW